MLGLHVLYLSPSSLPASDLLQCPQVSWGWARCMWFSAAGNVLYLQTSPGMVLRFGFRALPDFGSLSGAASWHVKAKNKPSPARSHASIAWTVWQETYGL